MNRPTVAAACLILVACGGGGGDPPAAADAARPAASVLEFTRIVVDAGASGDCKAIGDIDGDGRPDLVIGGASLVWYRNPGWQKTVIATARREFTTDCQAVDVDNDGRVDIVTGDGEGDGNVVWFRNRGGGTGIERWLAQAVGGTRAERWLERLLGRPGWWRHTIGTHGHWVHDVEVADLDGDGRPDLVTQGHGTHLWYQDPGNGWSRHELGAPARTQEGLGIGDVDGDGRIDLVQGGWWFGNPGGRATAWTAHPFATGYDGGSYTAAVADLNADGRPDIVLAEAHQRRELAWFEAPADPRQGPWPRHRLAGDMGAHKLNVADMDGDGRPDIVAGLERAELRIYTNDGGATPGFSVRTIDRTGCHNARVGDVNGDGSPDILCANYIGHPPLVLWLAPAPPPLALDRWQYIRVDAARARTGRGRPAFGLAFGDVDGDRRTDIVSGRYVYRNPGGDLTGPWNRTAFPVDVDAMLVLDVDGDRRQDVVAQDLPELVWLRPGANGGPWTSRVVARLPPTEHGNGQGYRLARIDAGSTRPELVFTTGDGIWVLRIPDDPAAGDWPSRKIASSTTEDLLAVGDLDGDGLDDVVASDAADGRTILWYRNPGDGSGHWKRRVVGEVADWADRAEIVDLNRDGRRDIVVSAENGKADGAGTHWFEAPPQVRTQPWTRHLVALQGSSNSLSVADMDHDGRPELITGEHKGALRVRIWRSADGGRSWHDTVVGQGHESHLGARAVDLDGDGAPEIVSIGYDAPELLHLWRNDARRPAAPASAAGASD